MTFAPDLVRRFEAALGPGGVIKEPEELRVYECDGLTGRRVIPSLVTLPETTEQVQAVVRVCNEAALPFVARGAGTGLSGGALPVAEGIVISLARMTRVLSVDSERGRIVVQPGVTNLDVTRAVAAAGFFYAPDPSSQQVCTIGGNVAENSGGAHCLKYGFTTNHVLAATVVLPDGEAVGLALGDPGPDLLGLFVGSEGTLGIATEVTLRVLRRARDGADAARGLPLDRRGRRSRLGHDRGRDHARGDRDDGPADDRGGRDGGRRRVPAGRGGGADRRARRRHGAGRGGPAPRWRRSAAGTAPADVHVAAGDAERAAVWRGRKSAFAAMGRISPDYYVQDGVVPRTKLPEVLRRIDVLSREYGLRVGNVFHAGDGNLHPLVLYDGAVEGEPKRAEELARQDPRGVPRRRRLAHRRARRRHRQGVLDAADVRGAGSRGDAPGSALLRPGGPLESRQGAFRPRASAARSRAPTACTRSRRQASLNAFEPTHRRRGVGLHAGRRARRDRDDALDRRLDAVLEHEPGDLTCVVEAGIRLSALNARLGELRPAAHARPARRPDARRPASRPTSRGRAATASEPCATSCSG